MSLKNLIALQKGNQNAKPAAVGEAAGNAVASESLPVADAGATQPEQLPREPESAPEAPRQTGLGLNLLGGRGSVGKQRSQGTPASPKPRASDAPVHKPDSGDDDGAVFGLADLAGFDASDDTAPARPTVDSGFADEIEATAPERAITPDMTPQQMNFIESLDSIYPVLHDPDLFGQAVRIIMLELQENREYKRLIADQDVHTMIRGMRNTMGMAKVRKQEKSRKTGGAGKASRSKKAAVSDDDMALLNNLLGDFGDD